MIFATCGSSHLPFERMMRALASLPRDDLEVQHGPAMPPPCRAAEPYLPFDQVLDRIERADVVVSHAGVGSILCAVRAGHTPVIFPRLKRYAETVDDHQAELAEALAASGTVILVRSPAELAGAIDSVPARGAARGDGGARLIPAVRRAICDDGRARAGVGRGRVLGVGYSRPRR